MRIVIQYSCITHPHTASPHRHSLARQLRCITMSENHNPNLPSSSSCSLGSHATRAPLASRSVSKAKKRGSTKIKRKVRSSVKGATRATLSSIVRRRWSKDEDEKLLRVVQKYGSEESDGSPRNVMWKEVAAEFKTRTPKACRDRWCKFICCHIVHVLRVAVGVLN